MAALLVLCSCSIFSAALNSDVPASGATLSVEAYGSELQGLSKRVAELEHSPEGAAQLRQSLPRRWSVRAGDRSFEISTDPIRNALDRFIAGKEEAPDQIPAIQAYILSLRNGAEAYATATSDSTATGKLDAILSGREFRGVHGQSWIDALKDKLLQFFIRLLTPVFGAIGSSSLIGRIFLWVFLAVSVIVLAIWVKRIVTRAKPAESAVRNFLPPSVKSAAEWLAEAKAAAAESDFRQAIHLAYWAGISHLESSGAWKPSRARTPREYLALLPRQGNRRVALSAITRRFEVIWYGDRPATGGDLAEVMEQLEGIGCR